MSTSHWVRLAKRVSAPNTSCWVSGMTARLKSPVSSSATAARAGSAPVVKALRAGLEDFNRKLRGFDQGVLVGLESKTSSPLQVLRDRQGLVEGFENLYMAGEGSGYAGGIISSGADGVKAALAAASAG